MKPPECSPADRPIKARRRRDKHGAQMPGLKDRTVLVTGGANGIGAATARRLAEEGCRVGILDVDIAAGEGGAGQIEGGGWGGKTHGGRISDQHPGGPAGRRLWECVGAGGFSR